MVVPHPVAPLPWPTTRVTITGGAGFLGSAVTRGLLARGVNPANLAVIRSREFDLRDPAAAHRMFENTRPDVVIHCAGFIGGIQLNRDQPGRMFHDNMLMALNLIEGWRWWSDRSKTAKDLGVFVQIGSMTSYPGDAPTPFREDSLWRGLPEPASAAYGVAKLAAWSMLDGYRKQYGTPSAYLIPVNLYGPGDNIDDVSRAHVAGSLVKRFVDAAKANAPEVVCWGTGSPTREFLYVEDAAEAIIRAAEVMRDPTPINIGSGIGVPTAAGGKGQEVSIRELAELIGKLAGYHGNITWDTTKPDGIARRCLDSSRAHNLLGWCAKMPLEDGLRRTVGWYAGRENAR